MKLRRGDLERLVGPERAAALLAGSTSTARPSGPMRLPAKKEMSKPEALYSMVLAAEFRTGATGYRVEFETLTLHLASGTRYTPDFTVWFGETLVLAVEVKGPIKLKSLDRATIKFKEAITSFPHIKFRHAFQDGLTGWGVQERRHNDPK